MKRGTFLKELNKIIEMSTLAIGVYVLKFSDGNKSKSIKIIKE